LLNEPPDESIAFLGSVVKTVVGDGHIY